MDTQYYIHGINGPVITVKGGRSLPMMSLVYVGNMRLPGEVVSAADDTTIVQVYEDSSGLVNGQPVYHTGMPMTVMLGPGMLGGIYDGIARPLKRIADETGFFITKGISFPAVDTEKKWDVTMDIVSGDELRGGMVFARCAETPAIEHRCTVPPGVKGTARDVASSGSRTVTEVLAVIEDSKGHKTPLTLSQIWPIRKNRPVKKRLPVSRPLITGQRIIDTLFPLGKGGCAAIPGPFGAGKTMVQHQLAKWSDADVIVYLGCGERGNEMTQVLEEFSELTDPRNGRPLMERTILIANTSNMPVAAREASIYTGITMAEYYRDMGYHVALMADSTSRWAEALREISGRLEEMPAEESFPAYLPSRLAGFYERAGYAETTSGTEGSVTIVGAVSPQGGDFSEPVTQNTKRFIRCFWALDRALAYSRHFPALNWTESYSEYHNDLAQWYDENFGPDFNEMRMRVTELLKEETSLMEIVKLIGADVLPDDQKLVIEITKVIREGFLQQNAFHSADSYTPPAVQASMLEIILHLYDEAKTLTLHNIPLGRLTETGIFSALSRMKFEFGAGEDKERFLTLINDAVSKVMSVN
ncbi:MAG: V-type ATP synthase subunit A [Oscillospiraceae bacterium]|nr:V-type ATP synthase subunit A [Oscillospiraceae bacterium]